MSKLYLSSFSLFGSASIGVESNTITTPSISSQSVLKSFYIALGLKAMDRIGITSH